MHARLLLLLQALKPAPVPEQQRQDVPVDEQLIAALAVPKDGLSADMPLSTFSFVSLYILISFSFI